jgi:hypothetical protein
LRAWRRVELLELLDGERVEGVHDHQQMLALVTTALREDLIEREKEDRDVLRLQLLLL